MVIQNSANEVLSQAITWLEAGFAVELVTVARTWGSSPRPPGSLAVIREDGIIVGSVSGGCVEKQLSESFKGQVEPHCHSHRIDDQEARRYGLACGGNLELVFETLSNSTELTDILAKLASRDRVKRVVSIGSQNTKISRATREEAFHYDGLVMQQVFGPAWRLLLIGAGQLSRYTAEFALALDYEVIVAEPRAEFRQSWQVEAARLVPDMPDDAVLAYANDAQSAVLALTHDPNLDDLALLEALPSEAYYVGALGSKKNYQKRRGRLEFLGLSIDAINRLHGPIGLPIGSRTSAEIAISIMAELVQVRSTSGT